jgi:hypothetical protein
MAKLNQKLQKQTEKAESSGFEPIPDGAYHVKLRDVDTTRSGAKGPYWSWEFEIVDEEFKGRRLWNNTSLSEAAAFKMKETFEAFDVPLDTDTDELIGEVVKAVVSQRTIQEGQRKGEVANQIDRLKKADADILAGVASEKKANADMDEIF